MAVLLERRLDVSAGGFVLLGLRRGWLGDFPEGVRLRIQMGRRWTVPRGLRLPCWLLGV